MPSLRIATFNCENLMMRCDFREAGLAHARKRLTEIDNAIVAEQVDSVFNVLSEDDRTLTAQALAETQADVCALQEVENLVTLTAFDMRYVADWLGRPFGERALIEGNDSRGIDVGVLSRFPIAFQRSHRDKTYGSLNLKPPQNMGFNDTVFRRDCLEVDVVKDGRALTLFVCHFKSMHGGREATQSIREAEAEAVRRIISMRFEQPEDADWLVLGDFNDYCDVDGQPVENGLGPLLDDGFAVDLAGMAMADTSDRWTHHYPEDDTYGALDHIFLSPRLAALNQGADVSIVRAGSPYRAERYEGFRYPGIGWHSPKASDHCPLAVTIQFEGRAVTA